MAAVGIGTSFFPADNSKNNVGVVSGLHATISETNQDVD
jgi:hypothetical protein